MRLKWESLGSVPFSNVSHLINESTGLPVHRCNNNEELDSKCGSAVCSMIDHAPAGVNKRFASAKKCRPRE